MTGDSLAPLWRQLNTITHWRAGSAGPVAVEVCLSGGRWYVRCGDGRRALSPDEVDRMHTTREEALRRLICEAEDDVATCVSALRKARERVADLEAMQQ